MAVNIYRYCATPSSANVKKLNSKKWLIRCAKLSPKPLKFSIDNKEWRELPNGASMTYNGRMYVDTDSACNADIWQLGIINTRIRIVGYP